MEAKATLKNDLDEIITNWFLSDSRNKKRIFNKYRYYFIDYDNYRDVVVDVYEKFSKKLEEENDSKYATLKYFFTAFINKAKDNKEAIDKYGKSYLQEFDEYTSLKSMLNESDSYSKRAIDSVRTVHYNMRSANLTHDEVHLYILSNVRKRTHESIANELGVAKSTIKYRLKKIRQKIKHVVESKYIGDFSN